MVYRVRCPDIRYTTYHIRIRCYTQRVPTLIDRYYRYIRPYRFLYGWAKDHATKARCSRRAGGWRAKGFKGVKLHAFGGCIPINSQEYLNLDIVYLPKVDLVFDITKCFPIDDGVIAEIFSAATLEHLRKPQVDHVLREFYRILQPSGMVRVSTPDIEAIAHGILHGEDLDLVNQYLFGKYKSDRTEDYDLHRWMYPAKAMMEVLGTIGFERMERLPMDVGLHHERYNYLIRAWKP